MRHIPRELFEIAEDFDLGVFEYDRGIGVEGGFQDFCGFMVDLSIRLSDSGNSQLAFDLAKSARYDYADEEFLGVDFAGYQFSD